MFQTTNQTNVCTISRSVGIKGASLLADIEWHILGYSADRIGEETLEEPWDLLIVGSHKGGQRGLVAGLTVGRNKGCTCAPWNFTDSDVSVIFCSYFPYQNYQTIEIEFEENHEIIVANHDVLFHLFFNSCCKSCSHPQILGQLPWDYLSSFFPQAAP